MDHQKNSNKNFYIGKPKFSCNATVFKEYFCNVGGCNFQSDFAVSLKNHSKIAHTDHKIRTKDKYYALKLCKNCDFKTYSLLVLCGHIRECKQRKTSTDENNSTTSMQIMEWFNCKKCPYKTQRKHNLTKHFRLQHTDPDKIRWYNCDQCSFKAKQKSNLNAHYMYRHTPLEEVKWFSCKDCCFRTKINANLRNHVISKHTSLEDIQWFQCSDCPFKAKMKRLLDAHTNRKHRKHFEWFCCVNCSYKTPDKCHLARHTFLKHTDPKNITYFECHECTSKFKLKANLKAHITRIHKHQ